MRTPQLSIVVPAFNEAHRLPNTLAELLAWAAARPEPGEVLLVDDGSRDDTRRIALAAAARHDRLRVLSHFPNRGKGFAVRRGVLAARGQCILLTDCDLATPLSELPKLEAAMRAGAALAFGSRVGTGAELLRRQSATRETLGRLANRLIQTTLPTLRGFGDTQCGFKLYDGATARRLFPLLHADGWGFDFECIHLFRRAGLAVAEVPVRWSHGDASQVRPIHYLTTLHELLGVRCRDLRGYYTCR